jgi:hypothetical protein
MAFPFDCMTLPVVAIAPTAAVMPRTDQVALEAAVAAIAGAGNTAKRTFFLPGILIARRGLSAQAIAEVEVSGLPPSRHRRHAHGLQLGRLPRRSID